MLTIKGLHAGYRAMRVLRGVDLRVETGSIVAVLGPNGAGKSTLLRAVAGLVRPTDGTISFEGENIERWTTERIVSHGVALVPEGRGVLGSLSVTENLKLGAMRLPRSERAGAIEDAVERFPALRKHLKRSAALLSGGEQQQLVIARAWLTRPRLLVLDEPSLGLSPRLTAEIMTLVADLRDGGATVLLVEQGVAGALALADYSYVLVSGEIVASGPRGTFASPDQLTELYMGNPGGSAA